MTKDEKGNGSTPFPCVLAFFLVTPFLYKSSRAVLPVQARGVTFTAAMTVDYKGPYSLGSCIILKKQGSGFTHRCVRLSAPPSVGLFAAPSFDSTTFSPDCEDSKGCEEMKLGRVRAERRGHIQRDRRVFQGSVLGPRGGGLSSLLCKNLKR